MSLKPEAIWAASPTTIRGQSTPLSCDAKGERIAYASGKSIFVRSIDDPSISKQYTLHTTQTTVAKFSPSGYYVASGDVSGTVRVWDCVGEGATKGEYHIIAGRINDLAWDGDSQRIIAVGEGKERMGHCITWDSGNSVGEISGHSNQINSVSIRQQRPIRAATVSDDSSLVFYTGPPFKFSTSVRGKHDKFIFGTAFSPDGSNLVSVGADKRICFYDGKTGEYKSQIGEGVHTGSIFGVAWSKDSSKIVTASADQTVRIWDVEAGKNITTWRLGEEGVVNIPHQQVGVAWPSGRNDGLIISVDLDGNLNYLKEGSTKPVKIVQGHQKGITASSLNDNTFYTGSYEGRISSWDISKGLADKIDGQSHSNYVSGLSSCTNSDKLYSIAWDDTLKTISAKTFTGNTLSVSGQPKSVTVSSQDIAYVATLESIEVYKNGTKINSLPIKGSTSIAAIDNLVAIGFDDKSISIYTGTTSGDNLKRVEKELRKATAAISTLSFSTDGKYLAAGVSNGKILVYKTDTWEIVTDRWSAHSARVTSIAWDATNSFAVSGSLDTNVYVWSLKEPAKRIKALNAHKDGVSGVAWSQNGLILSTGGDSTVKTWKV